MREWPAFACFRAWSLACSMVAPRRGFGSASAMNASPSEHVVYQDAQVTVTTARAVLNGVTYAMANVTSVRTQKEPRPLALLLFGLLLCVVGGCGAMGRVAFGPVFLVAGAALAIWYFASKPKYWVRLGTAGGETNATFSRDATWTASVVAAMNEAIVRRG